MKKNNKIFPVTLFQGTQSLLIDREIEKIREFESLNSPGLDHLTFHLDTDSVEKVIRAANTVPMFGGRKLLVARNAESLNSKEVSKLNDYINTPSPDTLIVLVSEGTIKPKLKKNKNLTTVNFNKINMIESKIQKEAEMLGVNISRRACMEIHRLVGDDFTLINNELLKISNYFGNEKLIDEKDIENFILKRKEEDVFSLVNSISNGQLQSAVKILKNLEDQKYEPLSIVSTLSWRIRQIWQVKELISLNKSDDEIMKKMKISSGAVYYIKKQAANFSIKSLAEITPKLKKIDTELKSYNQNKYNLLSRFVIELCNQTDK